MLRISHLRRGGVQRNPLSDIFQQQNRYGKAPPRDVILRLPFLRNRLRNSWIHCFKRRLHASSPESATFYFCRSTFFELFLPGNQASVPRSESPRRTTRSRPGKAHDSGGEGRSSCGRTAACAVHRQSRRKRNL